MSLFACSITPERALVAADTACIFGDAPFVGDACAKLYLIPHLNTVMAGIGALAVQRAAMQKLWSLRNPSAGFDEAADSMRAWLDEIHDDLVTNGSEAMAACLGHGTEIYLIGWSATHKRMHGCAFIRNPGGRWFNGHLIERQHSSPPAIGLCGLPEPPATVDEIAALANAAARVGLGMDPTGAFGGRLVIAEIGRDTMSTSVRDLQPVEATEEN